uniref:Protein kinase domain-containing protein n=1 Tax=Populus trichocarpa TaxID=3694 RepID=A0A3N7FHZ8_POPTR
MNPRVSDFGMARIFGGDQKQANTNGVAGTHGYMAPEYAMQGIFLVKSYVFGFGVLLLEIIAGKRRNGGFYLSDDGRLSLLSHGIYGMKAKQWRLWIKSWKKHVWLVNF